MNYPTKADLEHNPSLVACITRDYDPDADGWKKDAQADLRAQEQAVADYCHDEIQLGERCDCVQAHGYHEQMLANTHCVVCAGKGRPTVETVVSGVDQLGDAIDELVSTAGEICQPAQRFLALAWWHAENAIRKVTGNCSMGRDHKGKDGKGYCACCSRYNELKAKAERAGRML